MLLLIFPFWRTNKTNSRRHVKKTRYKVSATKGSCRVCWNWLLQLVYIRQNVFYRVWLNSKTFKPQRPEKYLFWLAPFYLDTSHFFNPRQNFMDPRHQRHFFDHAKILWTHLCTKFYEPTPPTNPGYPRNPRYLADSVVKHNDCKTQRYDKCQLFLHRNSIFSEINISMFNALELYWAFRC